ncbi:MAG: Kae1-associated serine/threonine protein kinase [Nitrososphaerota archaeon]|jgi:TP53 regulating kinase-like protein|nr:Kae1-associated serine/threonine protein kinase [Nitrososphaerota archaeon]
MDELKQQQPILLKKGAEASLYVSNWHGRKALVKIRMPKKYRPESLDKQIRSYRTIHEGQLLHQAKGAGVATPLIFMIDVPEATIIMEYIEGVQVKQQLNMVQKEGRREICLNLGGLIGKLHKENLIHGDLTTSNMIIDNQGKIFLLDFGLGEKNVALEAKGVDLHLLKRALQSTHFSFWETCFKDVLTGYRLVAGVELTEKVYEKISEIEKRGRYIEERRQ